jgi:hypothetical protein
MDLKLIASVNLLLNKKIKRMHVNMTS